MVHYCHYGWLYDCHYGQSWLTTRVVIVVDYSSSWLTIRLYQSWQSCQKSMALKLPSMAFSIYESNVSSASVDWNWNVKTVIRRRKHSHWKYRNLHEPTDLRFLYWAIFIFIGQSSSVHQWRGSRDSFKRASDQRWPWVDINTWANFKMIKV